MCVNLAYLIHVILLFLESISEDFSRESLTAQIVGLINQPFVTVNISDAPQKGFANQEFELCVPPTLEESIAPEKSYSLTTLSSSPIDASGSELLEFVQGFEDDVLDSGPLADPNLLFDFGPIPTSVLEDTDDAPEVPEVSLGDLPVLLDSFRPDDVDNIGQDEIDSILTSYPSSPTESMDEASGVHEIAEVCGERPALEGFMESEIEEPKPRRSRQARVARPKRSRRPKPYDDFVLEEEREGRPLGRPSDPTLVFADRKMRKKDQNRDAALRYRQKKKKEMDSVYDEAQRLEENNRDLKDKVEELTHDIDLLKNILREKYLKEGKQLPVVLKSK